MADEPTVYSATKQLSQKGKEKLFNALDEYIDAKIIYFSSNLMDGPSKENLKKARENLQNLLNYLKIEVE